MCIAAQRAAAKAQSSSSKKRTFFFCRKQASQTWALVMEIHVCAHRIKPERIATVPVCICEGFEIALGSHVLHPCQSHSPWWCWVAVTGCNHCTRRSQARTRRLCKGFLARNREHGAVLCLQSPFLQTRTYMKSSATPFRFIWQPGRATRDHTYVRARLFHLFSLPVALAFLARMEMQQLKGALAENKRSCRLPPI